MTATSMWTRAWLFVSAGDGTLSEESSSAGIVDQEVGHGIVCADFDNDGDVDILQAHLDETNAATLWRNDSEAGNYLRVKLVGEAPNTQAAGARISATIGDTVQIRDIMIGSNFTSQNPTVQIFGLDDATQVDRLEVEWPNGDVTTRTDVRHGQTVTIDHPRM